MTSFCCVDRRHRDEMIDRFPDRLNFDVYVYFLCPMFSLSFTNAVLRTYLKMSQQFQTGMYIKFTRQLP